MTSTFDTTLANIGIGRTGASTPTVAPAGSGQTLGQADFLKLMTAQMQNQDPFNPVDNTQMVAQMAQFSSLSGISEMNSTLKSIADKLTGTSANDALAYVGKTVLTEGDTAFGRTTGGIAGAIDVDSAASDLKVTIQDQNGNTLKTLDLGAQTKGTVNFDWDGKTEAGVDAARRFPASPPPRPRCRRSRTTSPTSTPTASRRASPNSPTSSRRASTCPRR